MTSQYTRDAIIYNERAINDLIWRIRNGKNPSPRTISMYREHVMALSELLVALDQQEKSEAKAAGRQAKIVEWIMPDPVGQIVGVTDPDEKRSLEWHGWFKSLARPVTTPIRQPRKIAA